MNRTGDRGEPRVVLRPNSATSLRARAGAMTISPPQYDVPLLPPRIGMARADQAVVRRQEEAAKARVGAR